MRRLALALLLWSAALPSFAAITFSASATASGTSTGPNVTHGLTITTGQVVIGLVHKNFTTGTITDNNGATPFSEGFEIAYASARYAVYGRVAGASEPSNYAWTISTSQRWAVVLMVFNGVDSAIWDVQPSTATDAASAANPLTLPAITVTAGAMGIAAAHTDFTSDACTSCSDGYANEISVANQAISVWRQVWASAGDTTTVDMGNGSGGEDDMGAVHFSLKEAAAGGSSCVPCIQQHLRQQRSATQAGQATVAMVQQ